MGEHLSLRIGIFIKSISYTFSMAVIQINYIAVVAAAVVNIVIAAVWYAPFVFGKWWLEIMRDYEHDVEKLRRRATKSYVILFIAGLIMSFVLAHFIDYVGAVTVWNGVTTGFWLWLGFVAATNIMGTLFEGRSKKLYAINTGYYLMTLVVMGVILAVWV